MRLKHFGDDADKLDGIAERPSSGEPAAHLSRYPRVTYRARGVGEVRGLAFHINCLHLWHSPIDSSSADRPQILKVRLGRLDCRELHIGRLLLHKNMFDTSLRSCGENGSVIDMSLT
jgi:hypothetical protein